MSRPRARRTRRFYVAEADLVCVRCTQPIHKGARYVRDITKQPSHPQCRRLNISTRRVEQPRFQFDSAVGAECDGCGDTIREGEEVVHVLAKPWHTECRKRR